MLSSVSQKPQSSIGFGVKGTTLKKTIEQQGLGVFRRVEDMGHGHKVYTVSVTDFYGRAVSITPKDRRRDGEDFGILRGMGNSLKQAMKNLANDLKLGESLYDKEGKRIAVVTGMEIPRDAGGQRISQQDFLALYPQFHKNKK